MKHDTKHIGRRANRRGESGQHLVEFALVLLPLVLLLAGICQYGFLYTVNMAIRNASVAAARYAVLSTTNAPTVAKIQNYAEQAVAADPFLNVNNVGTVTVEQNVVTVDGTGGATSVQIVYNLPLVIPLIVPGKSAGDSITLTATTIMR